MHDCERVLVEGGEVVGNTAIIQDTGEITQSSKFLPSGYNRFWQFLIIVCNHRLRKIVS